VDFAYAVNDNVEITRCCCPTPPVREHCDQASENGEFPYVTDVNQSLTMSNESEPEKRAPSLSLTDTEKVEHALETIKYAQRHFNLAADQLATVDGFAEEWSASADVSQAIKQYWHLVDHRLTKIGQTASDRKQMP
jgi:hypothetical protein